jgi:beta-N-acetylhexosaminidase
MTVGLGVPAARPLGTARRPGVTRPLGAAAVALTLVLLAGPAASAATPSVATLQRLVGQRLMVAMDGTTPSPSLLARIGSGEVGGVILFGRNLTTKTALVALTSQLHHAATAAGQPRLLIAVDQEGGTIKRIPWAPPTLSPPQMGALASTPIARAQGLATGQALKALGIDVDLAPIADVPASTASFLYLQHRTWWFSASRTASLAVAFAEGLQAGGVIPVLKHFPGLGYATLDTDQHVVTIRASAAALAPGLLPYRMAVGATLPAVMLSNATYTAWDAHAAAGWSPAINTTLLRGQLGFRGVTMTDSLDGTAAARGLTASHLAERAAIAGTDLILLTGSEATSRQAFSALLADAESGRLPVTGLEASSNRILALKNPA